MTTFQIALENVIVTLLYMVPGYIVCKSRKTLPQHLPGLSGVLIYICSPCMVVNAMFEQDLTWERLGEIGIFSVITFAVMLSFMLLVRLFLRDSRDAVISAAGVLGNVGFFGLPIVKAILPACPEASAFSIAYILSMNVLAFTFGVYSLTEDKKYINLKRAFLNPTMISFIIGVILNCLGVNSLIPAVGRNAIRLVGDMCTPFCLFILGVRLADMSLKKVFAQKKAYLAIVIKLLLYPLFAYAIALILPISQAMRASLLVLSATPCASILLNLAEMHDGNKEMPAVCCLLSTLLCFITIPLLTLLL